MALWLIGKRRALHSSSLRGEGYFSCSGRVLDDTLVVGTWPVFLHSFSVHFLCLSGADGAEAVEFYIPWQSTEAGGGERQDECSQFAWKIELLHAVLCWCYGVCRKRADEVVCCDRCKGCTK